VELTPLDIAAFAGFILFVVCFSIWVSRKEESADDYFLAGRKLTWWLIGISLIASNISTEHFVGMAGRGFELGMAIASYEWTAAVAMVLVALFFLPKFLRTGITTIPEYLEYRYSVSARGLMAFYMMFAYVFVAIAAVVYAGALNLQVVFGDTVAVALKDSGFLDRVDLPGLLGDDWLLVLGGWVIGIVAGIYTVWGGLKAVVWADLFNGVGLLLGGVLVTMLGFLALGGDEGFVAGVTSFFDNAGDKLSVVKPFDHGEMPWVAVFIGGLWLPQIFYWGLNQFIAQRALGAKSVAEGQKGVLFAACLKLLIPFIIVFPGIMAWQLAAQGTIEISKADAAYPRLITAILPPGLRGLMFACLFGAVMSSLDSMLNSASTIFTMDLYKRHLKKDASNRSLIRLGRVLTALFVILGCLWAPYVPVLGGDSVFVYIQRFWGFLTPGIVAAFLFGIFSKRTPGLAAVGAMLLGIPIYAWCLWMMPQVAFLHHMALTFIALAAYMMLLTVLMPLKDVKAGSDEDGSEPGSGVLKMYLVPYGTVVLGGLLLSLPIFTLSHVLTSKQDPPLWVHFAVVGVAITVYIAVALFAMRRPTPTVRRVVAEPAKVPLGTRLGVSMFRFVGGLAAMVILAIHVYLFSIWVSPTLKRVELTNRYLGPCMEQSYDVMLPVISRPRETVSAEEGLSEEATSDSAEVDPIPDEHPELDNPEPPVVEVGRFGGYLVQLRRTTVEIWALVTAGVAAAVFALALFLISLQPAAGEADWPVTDKIDLKSSAVVKVWGLLIIAATVGLYYFFF
jgi:solute:Na+ symporter, SSS family